MSVVDDTIHYLVLLEHKVFTPFLNEFETALIHPNTYRSPAYIHPILSVNLDSPISGEIDHIIKTHIPLIRPEFPSTYDARVVLWQALRELRKKAFAPIGDE